MPDANNAVEVYLKKFLEADEKRRKDPVWGARNAEQALMKLCEFIKHNGNRIDDSVKIKAVRTLQNMNLVPYRTYCREHLLDIGIHNV